MARKYRCKKCRDAGFFTIKVEKVVGARTETRKRQAMCNACTAGMARVGDGAVDGRMKRRGGCSAWPMVSYSAGVSPSQVAEARKHAREIGIPTEFTKQGDAIFTSREHRRRYCEAIGMYDRNGGYGDPQRRDRNDYQHSGRHGLFDIGV